MDIEKLKKLADSGNMFAQFDLADRYYKSNGVAYDFDRSIYWFKKAAEQGHSKAQRIIGEYYWGVEENPEMAVYWFKKAADQGEPYSQAKLGNCYITGAGLEINEAAGIEWLIKSVKQGNVIGYFCLGLCYFHGIGVVRDINYALELINEAARLGDLEARNFLLKLKKDLNL